MRTEVEEIHVYEQAKSKALYILSRADKTEHEIKTRLKEKGYPVPVVDRVLEFLKEYGYINDCEYASNYIMHKNKTKSIKQISYELIRKGVNKEIVREAIGITNPDQSELIEKYVLRKVDSLKGDDFKEENKLYMFLLRKGFDVSEIRKVIKKIKGDIK
jgi:regulatory protein